MRIELPGCPIPMARHRSFLKGTHIAQYDPQARLKGTIKAQMMVQVSNIFESDDKQAILDASAICSSECCSVNIIFYLPYPHARNQAHKNRMLWGLENIAMKPDIDNLAKFYLDCGNGCLWQDDKQIVELHLEKTYDENPRTVMEIMPKKQVAVSEQAADILEMISRDEFFDLVLAVDVLLTRFASTKRLSSDADECRCWLIDTAALLSKLADEYSGILLKICKKYPGFHNECAHNRSLELALKEGKCEKVTSLLEG